MAKKNETRAVGSVDAAVARAATDLTELGARFALVGGLAVSAWGEPRYTRDVDLAVGVARDDEKERGFHRGRALARVCVGGGVTHAPRAPNGLLSSSSPRDYAEAAFAATDVVAGDRGERSRAAAFFLPNT